MAARRGGSARALTERQAYWLKHIRTAEGRGEPLKHYAARKGLSEHAIYEAKRRLREFGAIGARGSGAKSVPRFARVVATPEPAKAAAPLRVRLPGGAVLEWSEAPQGESLRELLGLLAG